MLRASERAILVVVDFDRRSTWTVDDSLNELVELAKTSGLEVIDNVIARRHEPTAAFLIGKGKVEEIADLCFQKKADVVVFDKDLSSAQQRNLEEILEIKTIDRTQLILDIFVQHAKSLEGKTQVELAQLEYLLPRLVGKGIVLSRLGGGIGTRGPGETKLEVDRRRIRDRIVKIKKDLKDLSTHRSLLRKKRKQKHIASVVLVGYTNAGKTTLLNSLTDANQPIRRGLFTTLDSLSRQLTLPNHQKIVISDTVGFLNQLPHHLIEAFKATLEEVQQADLLLHVLDISHPKHYEHKRAVYEVLQQLQSDEKPIITVLNKIDKLEDRGWIERLKMDFSNAVTISALNKENFSGLLEKIQEQLSSLITVLDLFVPMNRMDLVERIHREGNVYEINYTAEGANIKASLPNVLAQKLSNYLK